MDSKLLSGPGLPGPAVLSLIAQELLRPDGPETVQYVLSASKDKPAHILHYFARHDLVLELLRDSKNRLSTKHYDQNMGAIPGQINLLPGEDNDQPTRWKILAAALDHGRRISRKDMKGAAAFARTLARTTLQNIKAGGGTETNLVREYGYVIPYLFAKEFVGLTPKARPSLLFRVFVLARNFRDGFGHKRRASDTLKAHGPHASANEYLLWSQLMFGQIFGNYGLRSKVLTFVSGLASKLYSKQVERSIRDNTPSPAPAFTGGTLIERLHEVKPDFVGPNTGKDTGKLSEEAYDLHVKSIVFEIIASFHILIGISFGHVLDVLLRQNIDLKDFAKKLGQKDGYFLLDTILNENPTTALVFRRARKPLAQYGIAKGDGLCFLITAASKALVPDGCPVSPSARRGECPNIPTPKDRTAFLNFGPNEHKPYELVAGGKRSPKAAYDIAHPCFGQYWARAILAEMFIALADEEVGLPDMEPADGAGAGVKNFAGIPDSFMVRFKS
ncbi:MAG: hypothetical protein COA69_03890 [Robiginitomaculum sp.]|nr:MAG: hypothetical protein COA69_03890 [Robiginitomaculum sp.]